MASLSRIRGGIFSEYLPFSFILKYNIVIVNFINETAKLKERVCVQKK
ncbi:hypothetical protein CDSM653_00442 [Caldanaerobacter subterraneus subsp. pacificus DSM 12653]|uniref:Uncharacterized protein n=1 Tax=Caldanaerobacter subterraneus subsp. pacificus DSM 12653 TaxID=391606 RepID=A0A0F5PPB6_9THEO|nr:hypothetical protein CDSM653_00442 [Caldanaerobacter subterraneus subsp. pacificus DSM 12653]